MKNGRVLLGVGLLRIYVYDRRICGYDMYMTYVYEKRHTYEKWHTYEKKHTYEKRHTRNMWWARLTNLTLLLVRETVLVDRE